MIYEIRNFFLYEESLNSVTLSPSIVMFLPVSKEARALSAGGLECATGGGGGGVEYKITLGRPQGAAPALARPLVSSTNPKTPSPSLNVSLRRRSGPPPAGRV